MEWGYFTQSSVPTIGHATDLAYLRKYLVRLKKLFQFIRRQANRYTFWGNSYPESTDGLKVIIYRS